MSRTLAGLMLGLGLVTLATGVRAPAQTIVVSGDRIQAVAPTAATPAQPGDVEIDLTRATTSTMPRSPP